MLLRRKSTRNIKVEGDGSKKQLLRNAQLYLILDTQVNPYQRLVEIASNSTKYGVDIVQLRDKKGSANDILRFSRRILSIFKGRVPYIINDRVDLAIAAGASGVHLGQDDVPLKTARKMMGPKAIIGVSCQTLEHALKAEQEGADYIGFGSVFKTLTKPDRRVMDLKLLRRVVNRVDIPVFAIGGIRHEHLFLLRSMGVRQVAVCRDICLARDIKKATTLLRQELARPRDKLKNF